MRREVDAAMRVTTSTLSQVTDLLAAVSAPPLHTATIKHVEVLLLQPQIALVVVITSTGAVTKRAFTFDEPVDAGLADWAASYLNERLAGTDLGALTLRSRLVSPGAVGDASGRSWRRSRPRSRTSPTPSRTRSTWTAPPACWRAGDSTTSRR